MSGNRETSRLGWRIMPGWISTTTLSRETGACHSSLGAKFGERIDPVKDAIGCLEQRPSQATGYGTGFAGASAARVLDGIQLRLADNAWPVR